MIFVAGLALFAFIAAMVGMLLYLLVATMWDSYTDYKQNRREYYEELYQDCLLRLQEMEEPRNIDGLREAEGRFMMNKTTNLLREYTIEH